MKNKNLVFFLLLILFIVPEVVKAENKQQYTLCFNEKGAYSISYDADVATEVTKDKLKSDYNSIVAGHLPYPDDISEDDKVKYQFTVVWIASKCYEKEDKSVMLCPESNLYRNIQDYYFPKQGDINVSDGTSNNELNHITMSLSSDGITSIKIDGITASSGAIADYKDKLYIRKVLSKENLNGYSTSLQNIVKYKDASEYGNEVVALGSNGVTITGDFDQTIIYIEFYLKDSSSKCNNSYIGYISFMTLSKDLYEVDNTFKDSTTCTNIRNYYPGDNKDKLTTDEQNRIDSMKNSFFPLCYGNSKVKYGELIQARNTYEDKFDDFKSYFTGFVVGNTIVDTICTDKTTSGRKISYSYGGTYWSMVCYETYEAWGDEPKLVAAGKGFPYATQYRVARTCEINPVKSPPSLPKCEYSINHTCSWPTKSGEETGPDGGPNEEFDRCILNCDGGNYTQKCINSCYKDSYKDDRELAIVDINRNNSFFVKTLVGDPVTFKAANTQTKCETDHGRPGLEISFSSHGKTDTACFSSDYCATHGGSCTFYVYKDPNNCVDNPKANWNKAVSDANDELNELKAIQSDYIPVGNYSYSIQDSYLTSGNEKYIFNIDSSTDPKVNVSQNFYLGASSGSASITYSYTENGVVKDTRELTYTRSKEYILDVTTSLPLSYVSKYNKTVAYKTDNGFSQNAFSINYKNGNKYELEKINNFKATDYYHNSDERHYYTSVWSPNINVKSDEKTNKVSLVDRNQSLLNIQVESTNVGDSNFSSLNKCYYGVYNKFYCKDPNDCPSEGDDPTGIQWIFRPIDLEDVFPNDRNPRWNWTGTLKDGKSTGAAKYSKENILKYDIDPIKLTQDIETKGNSIYTDSSEIDYEFVLTRENLNNIRYYNKHVNDYNGDGENNYGDFNMSCYKDAKNKEICTSKFLDNIDENDQSSNSSNFITYSVGNFTIGNRKSIAGCNNAKNGSQCDD